MSDEIGVDVERMQQMATALENLRDVLAANVPVIVSTMSQFWSGGTGQPISLLPLQQAVGKSVEDATAMRARAEMAVAFQHRPDARLPGHMVSIPWDASTAQLDADSGKAAAQDLAAAEAEASKNPAAARAEIAAIEADMQDHLDSRDTGWVQAFYDNGGAAAAANLAQTLHDLESPGNNVLQDNADRFQVLTSADQQTVASFANGLAIADKAGLSPQAVQSLVNSPNMWSTAMLIKYGPPGSSWATSEQKSQQNPNSSSLLALLTQAVYQDTENGKIRVPVGFGARYDEQDMTRLEGILESNDPLQVLMQADAQNKNAAWQVMGSKDGEPLAQLLLGNPDGLMPQIDGRFAQEVDREGQSTGNFNLIPPGKPVPRQDEDSAHFLSTPDQNVVGAFLDAATSAPRGTDINALESAQAAMNIILATQPPILGRGTVQPGYDPAIIKALMDTFMRYMPDIAWSTHQDGVTEPVRLHKNLAGQVDGGYNLRISRTDMTPFLQEVCSSPDDYAIVKGAVASSAGTALGLQLKGVIANGTDPYDDLCCLYGVLIAQNGNLHYSAGQIADTYNAQLNAEIAFGENFIKDIPVAGNAASTALSYDQQLAGLGLPQIPQFSTDNASAAAAAAQADMNESELMAYVPIVQGLAQNRVPVYSKETGWVSVQAIGIKEGWYVNGKVVPNGNFWNWVGSAGGAQVQDLSAGVPTEYDINAKYMEWLNWMELGHSENDQTGSP
jgi:hypothetical protein